MVAGEQGVVHSVAIKVADPEVAGVAVARHDLCEGAKAEVPWAGRGVGDDKDLGRGDGDDVQDGGDWAGSTERAEAQGDGVLCHGSNGEHGAKGVVVLPARDEDVAVRVGGGDNVNEGVAIEIPEDESVGFPDGRGECGLRKRTGCGGSGQESHSPAVVVHAECDLTQAISVKVVDDGPDRAIDTGREGLWRPDGERSCAVVGVDEVGICVSDANKDVQVPVPV